MSVMQSENYQRLGDVLTTVPGVTTSTSSSVGDDMSLSIRGFDATETATLLDGHPIGPVGAFGGGYNYNVSPFWGLSGVDVVFGSGATGLFGATTIAGAVNFQTINPTQGYHVSVTQGVGNDDKLMTGLLGTGSLGKLGFAVAYGVQGTNGNFPGGVITQTALLQSSVLNNGYKGAAPPPDLTQANIQNGLNTYYVTGQYSQYNWVGKLTYTFSPKTTLQFTSYAANDWSNSTGEGDNDYQQYAYVLYGAEQNIASIKASPGGLNTILVHSVPKSCKNTIAVLANTPSGYECMNAQQFRSTSMDRSAAASIAGVRSATKTTIFAQPSNSVRRHYGRGLRRCVELQRAEGPSSATGVHDLRSRPELLSIYHIAAIRLATIRVVEERSRVRSHVAASGQHHGSFPYTTVSGNSINVFATTRYRSRDRQLLVRDSWSPSNKFSIFKLLAAARWIASTHFVRASRSSIVGEHDVSA